MPITPPTAGQITDDAVELVKQCEALRQTGSVIEVWAETLRALGTQGFEKLISAGLIEQAGMDPEGAKATAKNIASHIVAIEVSARSMARSAAALGTKMNYSYIEPINEARNNKPRRIGNGLKVT